MHHRETNKPYYLLKPPVHSEHLFCMLGRIAAYPARPQHKFAPSEPTNANDLIGGLYRKPVVARDVRKVINRATSIEATTEIEKILSLHTDWGKDSEQSYKAPGFRRWDMVYPQSVFETLMKHEGYARDVISLLRSCDDKEAFFITGLLTCADMQVETGRSSELDMGARAAIMPDSAVSISLGGGLSSTSRSEFGGTYEGEVIIAASYVKLKLVGGESGYKRLLSLFKEREGNIPIEKYLPHSEGIFMDEGPDTGDLSYIMGGDVKPNKMESGDDGNESHSGKNEGEYTINLVL